MGAGKISADVIPGALQQVWSWIQANKLTIDIEKMSLKDISEAWHKKTSGRRIVIAP